MGYCILLKQGLFLEFVNYALCRKYYKICLKTLFELNYFFCVMRNHKVNWLLAGFVCILFEEREKKIMGRLHSQPIIIEIYVREMKVCWAE